VHCSFSGHGLPSPGMPGTGWTPDMPGTAEYSLFMRIRARTC
jgi:hypothetical protein